MWITNHDYKGTIVETPGETQGNLIAANSELIEESRKLREYSKALREESQRLREYSKSVREKTFFPISQP